VWYDAQNDINNQLVEVFMAVSSDGGDTFDPTMIVSDNPSNQSASNASRYTGNFLEYIGVACRDDTASVVWSDNSLDLADLDFFTDQVAMTTVPNEPPVADAGADQTVSIGDQVTLDGSGSFDPDTSPGPLTFSWTQTGGPKVLLAGAGTETPTWTPVEEGVYTFELIVNDGQDSSTPASVEITVLGSTPEQQIQEMIDQIEQSDFPRGLETSLKTSLRAALASLKRGNTSTALNQLHAFINKVNAQNGKRLPTDIAEDLISAAERITQMLQ
jgi:hypothetical protein